MDCKNCIKPLSVDDNYCNYCGAKVINHRLTLNHLFAEFYDRFVSLDNNAFFRTFISLYTKPKDVIDGYINGLRKRYINVAGYIALAITLSGFQLYIVQKYFPNSMKIGDSAFQQSWMESFTEYQSLWYLLLIPLYALVSRIVFYKNKKYNYTEHIVIIGYTQAQLSITFAIPTIILTFFGIDIMNAYVVMVIIMIVYTAYCLKSVFELNKTQLVLKTMLFFLIGFLSFFFIIILIVAIIFAYSNFTGSPNPFQPETVEKVGFVTRYSLGIS